VDEGGIGEHEGNNGWGKGIYAFWTTEVGTQEITLAHPKQFFCEHHY